jgi:anaerobic magnesium-protoporphyrin IX monomethyl ester cyclase
MTERRRVYGIVPPTGKYIREDRCQTPIKNLKTVALRTPIDLLYATGAFEASGCECRVDDYPGEDLTWTDLEARLREFRPQFLIMSITTPSLHEDMEAAALAKRVDPGIVTIAKGAHFNTLDVSSLEKYPALDIVLRGEIEETCMALGRGEPVESVAGITRRENGRVVRNPDRGFTQDLDSIPFPSRHLANNALYFRPDTGELQTTIITNRGCPFHCVYCLANQTAGVKNRYRSVENVIAEIRECVEKHNIRNFLFRSDLFTQNKRWVIRLCQAILDEGLDIEWACNSRVDTITAEALTWMKKAGCWIIAFGVESGSQETLDRIDKGANVEDSFKAIQLCREAGVKSSVYLLMGLPWDTRETIRDLERFAIELDPDILEIFYAYPFPGTPLYRICVEEGLIKDGDIPKQAYDGPAFPGLYLSVDEMKALRRKALRRFYLRPSKVFGTLRTAGSPVELANYVRLGFSQLKDLMVGG